MKESVVVSTMVSSDRNPIFTEAQKKYRKQMDDLYKNITKDMPFTLRIVK